MISATESVLLPTASGCGVKLVRQDNDGSTRRVNFIRYHLRQPWCLPLTRRMLLGMYVDSFNCLMKDSMMPSNPKNCCYVIFFYFFFYIIFIGLGFILNLGMAGLVLLPFVILIDLILLLWRIIRCLPHEQESEYHSSGPIEPNLYCFQIYLCCLKSHKRQNSKRALHNDDDHHHSPSAAKEETQQKDEESQINHHQGQEEEDIETFRREIGRLPPPLDDDGSNKTAEGSEGIELPPCSL